MSQRTFSRAELEQLLDVVKWGPGDTAAVDEVAVALRDGRIPKANALMALYIVGRSANPGHERVVASFLDGHGGPVLARLAIEALCGWFDLAAKYQTELLRFISRVPWDEIDEVRQMALFQAGDYLRSTQDNELLSAILAVATDESELDLIRDDAFRSLARGMGDVWEALPPTTSTEVNTAWRESVLERANERMERE